MRTAYRGKLKTLNEELICMGEEITQAIRNTLKALKTHDPILAQEIVNKDQAIDDSEKRIETLCLHLLLTEQPVASDLRIISSALKLITDMERIGDFAADVAEIILHGGRSKTGYCISFISEMGEAVVEMVEGAVRSFVEEDAILARRVCDADDRVDDLFSGAREVLVGKIREDEEFAERALDLMMVSKYLERIGDHATNVAEWTIYAVTGVHENTEK
ncbi:MAG: phosphate signaling complex protein PhoU [Clostridia bacterium]|nr:phosphate signaling complex protein PhoU [Clostridia bacterium]